MGVPRYAQTSANSVWSNNTDLWYSAASGGEHIGVPQDGDTVYLNDKTVSLDVTTSALMAIYAGVAASSTGAGKITCSVNGLTVTATTMLTGTATLFTFSGTGTLTINGVLTASDEGMEAFGLLNTSAGTVAITEIQGGGSMGMGCYGVKNTGIGASFVFTTVRSGTGMDSGGFYSAVDCTVQAENVYAGISGSAPMCNGIMCTDTCVANLVVTNAYGDDGSDGAAIQVGSTSVLNVTNAVGAAFPAIWLTSGTVTVTACNVTGGLVGGGHPHGIFCFIGTPTIKISGGVLTSGNGANTFGIYSASGNHVITLENATVINKSYCLATNSLFLITALLASNYFQFGTYKFPQMLPAASIKSGVRQGDVVGTFYPPRPTFIQGR